MIGGPNTANGKDVARTIALKMPRFLFDTSSPSTTEKDNCPAAASPLMQLQAIS